MSPCISGIKVKDQAELLALLDIVWKFTQSTIKPGGNLLCKSFMGMDTGFAKAVKPYFKKAVCVKPDASRSISTEHYLLFKGFEYQS